MIRTHVNKKSGDNGIIKTISRFESLVTAIIKGKEYNAKSIMYSVIINNAEKLDLYIEGKDEQKVYDALNKMFVLEEF